MKRRAIKELFKKSGSTNQQCYQEDNDEEEDEMTSMDRPFAVERQEYFIYKDVGNVVYDLASYQPLSIIWLGSNHQFKNTFGCVLKGDLLLEVAFGFNNIEKQRCASGMTYFELKLTAKRLNVLHKQIGGSYLALPMLVGNEYNQFYAIVAADWTEIDATGHQQYPEKLRE